MFLRSFCILAIALAALAAFPVAAEREDLGNGYMHHGVATPVSNHRGTVATVDGDGNNVVLVWLFDHRGGYAILMIDAATGAATEYPTPFPPGGDCPYASILSSDNKFYTHFNGWFSEFDPVERAFTFHGQTVPQMAMSMTEDDAGRIWSVTYPQSGVASFDPETRAFTDYGHVYEQNWRQYQRSTAADDTGWIYFGVGSTESQIIAFDPDSGTATPVVPDDLRVHGSGHVVRDKNGKVYGHNGDAQQWYELYAGKAAPIEKPAIEEKPIITGSQGLFHTQFPDGKVLKTCDTVERVLEVEDLATGTVTRHAFDYSSEGAHIMGIAVAPDGTIAGGTAFPMRFFNYDPKADKWVNRASFRQWNTVAHQGDTFFVGGYGGGFLLEWDPAKEWVETVEGNSDSNPLFLAECKPTINRPHELLAHPDGKWLVLAGTPGYGLTGGGLLFWDRGSKTHEVLEHTAIIPHHSTYSMATLPSGNVIAGTTISAGTGGEDKAEVAELYIMDLETKTVEWHAAPIPGVSHYTDLYVDAKGKVYGVADQRHFFIFDLETKTIAYQFDTEPTLGHTTSQQGPRVFVSSPEGGLYMLFRKGIAQVDTETNEITLLAESPVSIGPGGDYLDGRIYFGSGSHVYSYQVPEATK